MSEDRQDENMDVSSQESSSPSPSTSSGVPERSRRKVEPELSKKRALKSKPLSYKIHQYSSMSANYSPENILDDKPSDQSSRWSSDTNTPPQYLTLKVEPRTSIVTSIKFGKYEKTHVCNLKRFKVYGGFEESNMIELIDTGLRNDSQSETFPLRHLINGQYFPCRYVKIVPIQSWGPSFNFSIWFVELKGDDSPDLVHPALEWHRRFRENEAVRLCLKHFRQKNYTTVFEKLMQSTNIQLEHPRLTELHDALVVNGDYKKVETLIQSAIKDGLFDEFIDSQDPIPNWTPLISPDDALADELLSAGTSPSAQTPVATPGNLTPEDEANLPQVSVNQQQVNLGGVIPDPRVPQAPPRANHPDTSPESSQDSSIASTQSFSGSGASRSVPPSHPGPRGGHQMVIDGANQLMYLFGGWDGSKDLSDFWSYHIPSGKWNLISPDTRADGGPSQRSCHKMVIDVNNNNIFILGRYLDRNLREATANIKSDFYMYDVQASRWIMIADDTAAMGGPSLIFDHQMCIDAESLKIYVFGGQSLLSFANQENGDNKTEKSYSGLYEYHIPTNTWKKLRNDISVSGSNDELQDSDVEKQLKSRSSHSMLFHPGLRKLFIFGGQRKRDEHLNDFFTYSVDTDEVETITCARGSGMSNDPTAAIPAVGYTQRATIDCQRSEIHVMTGLNKDKDKNEKRGSAYGSQGTSGVSNSFWVYSIPNNKWTCFYKNENNASHYWSKMQSKEPRPRYAHQLVYDEASRVHYMFGGNPGGKQGLACFKGKEDKLRLGDFWRLNLLRPDKDEIFRRCCLLIRKTRFLELTEGSDDSLQGALVYLQSELKEVVNHDDKGEEKEYQILASQLFKLPGKPAFGSPVKKSRSCDTGSEMAKSEEFDEQEHVLRTELFDKLAVHFPERMTQPRGNLIDLIPHNEF